MKTNILLTIFLFVACCVIGCQHRQKHHTFRALNQASTDHTDLYTSEEVPQDSLQLLADSYESKIVALGKEVGRELTSDYYLKEEFFVIYVLDQNSDETVLTINAYDFEKARKFIKAAPIHLLK